MQELLNKLHLRTIKELFKLKKMFSNALFGITILIILYSNFPKFWTDRFEQTLQTQFRLLIRVYTVCYTV